MPAPSGPTARACSVPGKAGGGRRGKARASAQAPGGGGANPGGWVWWQPAYDRRKAGARREKAGGKQLTTTHPLGLLSGAGASAGNIVLYSEEDGKPPLVVFGAQATGGAPSDFLALPPPRDRGNGASTSARARASQPDQPSPRRSLRVAFTCNRCKTRNAALVNPTAWKQGTLVVQCDGCDAMHTLVDHLGVLGFDSDDFQASRDADPTLREEPWDVPAVSPTFAEDIQKWAERGFRRNARRDARERPDGA